MPFLGRILLVSIRTYWGGVHRKAFREAAKMLGLESPVKIACGAFIVLAVLVGLAFWGSADATRDEAIVRIAIALSLIGLFPFFYLWQMVSIPARMHAETKKPSPITLSAAIQDAQEGSSAAKYIQIVVCATEDLFGCQVILNAVAKENGDVVSVVYDQPLNAAWGGIPDRVIDINNGQEMRANLFSVSRQGTQVDSYGRPPEVWHLLPRTFHPDSALGNAIAAAGVYQLTVTASSRATKSETRTFRLRWGGHLNEVVFL
jgi:hypothetical protein